MFCNEEVFGGLPRSAETDTSLGGLPFLWVQQVKGEGMSWGGPKTQKKIALPAPHGSNCSVPESYKPDAQSRSFGSVAVAAMGELHCLIYLASPELGNSNTMVSTVTPLLPRCTNITLPYSGTNAT